MKGYTTPFRLGLIGAGRMGRTHMSAIAASDRVSITAIAEPVEAARLALSQAGQTVFPTVEDMLAQGDIDGVLIASPSPFHADIVERVAAAGLPILCEKPCGITSADAQRAASAAKRHGVLLQIAYWRRFSPKLQALRQRIAGGEFGEINFAACYQWDERPPATAFRTSSGGIFIDCGVHEFDQLRWLTGQDITSMRVVAGGVETAPHVPGDPESAQVLCEMSGGTVGLVSLGRSFPLGDICRAEIFGTKAVDDCRFLWPPHGDAAFHEALRLQAEAFSDAVQGKPNDGATADDAVAALKAAEQATALNKQAEERA